MKWWPTVATVVATLMMVSAAAVAAEPCEPAPWSRARCVGRCDAELDGCTARSFGKMPATDCRVEGLRCRRTCDYLDAVLGSPPHAGGWASLVTLNALRGVAPVR